MSCQDFWSVLLRPGKLSNKISDFVNHYLLKLSGSVETFGTNTLEQEYEVEPPP
jgi:hypothetical protein